MFGKSSSCAPETTFSQFLNDERKESDEEDNENGQNTTLDPTHYRVEIVTSLGFQWICERGARSENAGNRFVTESPQVE